MRKSILFLFFSFFLFSCSNEDDILSQDLEENTEMIDNNELSLKSIVDETYHMLGYGYDITEDFVGENSVKKILHNRC